MSPHPSAVGTKEKKHAAAAQLSLTKDYQRRYCDGKRHQYLNSIPQTDENLGCGSMVGTTITRESASNPGSSSFSPLGLSSGQSSVAGPNSRTVSEDTERQWVRLLHTRPAINDEAGMKEWYLKLTILSDRIHRPRSIVCDEGNKTDGSGDTRTDAPSRSYPSSLSTGSSNNGNPLEQNGKVKEQSRTITAGSCVTAGVGFTAARENFGTKKQGELGCIKNKDPEGPSNRKSSANKSPDKYSSGAGDFQNVSARPKFAATAATSSSLSSFAEVLTSDGKKSSDDETNDGKNSIVAVGPPSGQATLKNHGVSSPDNDSSDSTEANEGSSSAASENGSSTETSQHPTESRTNTVRVGNVNRQGSSENSGSGLSSSTSSSSSSNSSSSSSSSSSSPPASTTTDDSGSETDALHEKYKFF